MVTHLVVLFIRETEPITPAGQNKGRHRYLREKFMAIRRGVALPVFGTGPFRQRPARVSPKREAMSPKTLKIIRKTIHWLLAAGLVVYIVTGFGITEWQTVEPLTLGLLGKSESQQIHNAIEIPFVALLAVHFYLSLIRKKHKETA